MIKFENVFYQYDGLDVPALSDISLEIREGEYVALSGPNGCGKTTLIRHLNALVQPSRGVVTVDGLDTRDSACHKEIRHLVGMIFQHPDNQIVGMTVEEDVAFGPGNLGWPPAEIRRQVDGVLSRLGLGALAGRAPHTLSGGEKRLVALAGVLVMSPRYIAFDEPTAFLDPPGRRRVLEMMGQLRREGIGVIHITHEAQDMADADRLLVMEEGRIILDGPPREILGRLAEEENPGLVMPPAMELMHLLKRRGWPLATDVLSVEEAGEEIQRHLAFMAARGDSV